MWRAAFTFLKPFLGRDRLAMNVDSALVWFEDDTGEDRKLYKWIGGYDQATQSFERCPCPGCGKSFKETGWRKVRSYLGETEVINILCSHLVNSTAHSTITTTDAALAAINEFQAEWGNCITSELETMEDRREYRIWHWQQNGGEKPGDADPYEDIDEEVDTGAASSKAAPSKAAAIVKPVNPARRGALTDTLAKRGTAPVVTQKTLDIRARPPPLSVAKRRKVTETELRPGFVAVPIRQIEGLRDAIRRTRQTVKQLVDVAHGAMTVIENMGTQFQDEANVLASQEAVVWELLNDNGVDS